MSKHEQQPQCVPCTEYRMVGASVQVLSPLLSAVKTDCIWFNRSEVANLLWKLFSFGNIRSGSLPFKYLFIRLFNVCTCLCVSLCVPCGDQRFVLPVTGVIGGCEPLDMDVENQTLILRKNSKCS